MNYHHFECRSRGDGTVFQCHFVFLQNAISLRHSDTIDVRFLVNGKRITVALPHVAFGEYARRAGAVLTDDQAAAVAALYLTESLENGGDVENMAVSPDRVLDLAAGVTGTPGSLAPLSERLTE